MSTKKCMCKMSSAKCWPFHPRPINSFDLNEENNGNMTHSAPSNRWYPAKRALPTMLTHWQIGPFWPDTLEMCDLSLMWDQLDLVDLVVPIFSIIWAKTYNIRCTLTCGLRAAVNLQLGVKFNRWQTVQSPVILINCRLPKQWIFFRLLTN